MFFNKKKQRFRHEKNMRSRIRIRRFYKVTLFGFWAIIFYLHVAFYFTVITRFLILNFLINDK